MISFKFIKPQQYREIVAGQSGVVWSMNVPESHVAFIGSVACNWFPNTYWIWKVDGEVVEPARIERQLGEMHNPTKLDPPILAVANIEFIAYNNDSESHTFEVLCDGRIMKDKDGI